jgi:hypothetical protein
MCFKDWEILEELHVFWVLNETPLALLFNFWFDFLDWNSEIWCYPGVLRKSRTNRAFVVSWLASERLPAYIWHWRFGMFWKYNMEFSNHERSITWIMCWFWSFLFLYLSLCGTNWGLYVIMAIKCQRSSFYLSFIHPPTICFLECDFMIFYHEYIRNVAKV